MLRAKYFLCSSIIVTVFQNNVTENSKRLFGSLDQSVVRNYRTNFIPSNQHYNLVVSFIFKEIFLRITISIQSRNFNNYAITGNVMRALNLNMKIVIKFNKF